MKQIRKVVCAISGGVDSAVSAYLLKKRGFDVIGVHMINWDRVEEDSSNCPQSADQKDAEKVCNHLQIPFHVTNFVDKYWNEIFTYLMDNYRKGRTVVSDVLCNKAIKFDRFHKYAFDELQADAVATGHFARTSFGDFLEKRLETGCDFSLLHYFIRSDYLVIRLLAAVDPIKDQTFFLSTLTQSQLRRSMFPIGSLTKQQVRQIAVDIGMAEIAEKPESMGICFIGKRKRFDTFLDQYIEPVIGPAKDIDTGKVVFEHRGIHHYTIGKRITMVPDYCQNAIGLFAAGLDNKTQTLWVCQGSHHPALFAREFVVEEPLWISECPIDDAGVVKTEFRCQRTHPALLCELTRLEKGLLKVKPYNPIRAAAPGQICVFYNDSECLGGGEIQYVVTTLADVKN
ncbi:tRNA (5-methylaminomethyl-2-thiouridylate)-methyltransferase [Onchocerca flexuosa]|uniref:tRNA-5-taurinomethyluridine 2-sulfurtransferase n=1 Tax=Onchocerca flexuosa TaxID=387005 RepID=A0A238BTC6_9BILA|nr:tRNA (5-methylaminomethyl-2-thiouridylate)-methyltransferase [Onchocerca flexuosa]